MNKKGFTLIELLAVIVILAIIALIATPIILNMINNARKSAAVDSAYGYIEAVEYNNSMNMINKNKYPLIEDGNDIDITKINDKVNLKGTKPTSGIITIEKGRVKKSNLCIDGYSIEYDSKKAEVNGTCTKESFKKTGKVVLSSTNGQYTYPESKTIEVLENPSKGKITCESDNEKVATCKVTENIITITAGKEEGQATLTIKSEETEEYTEGKAAYLVNTAKGLLSITASDYVGEYDGKAHGITVTSSGATIKYGVEEGTYNLEESPTYIDAGTYKIYYEVSKDGYKTVTGSKTVTINKKEGTLAISETNGTISKGLTTTIKASNASGELSCSTSNSTVATCSINETTITIKGIEVGTANITITSASSKNYTSVSKNYNITVRNPTLSDKIKIGDYVKMTPTSTSYTIDVTKTGNGGNFILNPSELNIWRVIKINNDGTIEVVSENVSSLTIAFQSKTGYINYVGYLNEIASQYTNTKYVKSTRHMGYNGQTEYLTDTTSIFDSTITVAPWSCSTGESCNPKESQGGGDTLYENDTNLVNKALGTLKANISNKTKQGDYWLASRYYEYKSSDNQDWYFSSRSIMSGNIDIGNVILNGGSASQQLSVRPILTLKSGLTATGTGTSSDPYVLP